MHSLDVAKPLRIANMNMVQDKDKEQLRTAKFAGTDETQYAVLTYGRGYLIRPVAASMEQASQH